MPTIRATLLLAGAAGVAILLSCCSHSNPVAPDYSAFAVDSVTYKCGRWFPAPPDQSRGLFDIFFSFDYSEDGMEAWRDHGMEPWQRHMVESAGGVIVHEYHLPMVRALIDAVELAPMNMYARGVTDINDLPVRLIFMFKTEITQEDRDYVVGLGACSHTVTDDGGAGHEVFPSRVGATWTYRWRDYRNETVDTVVVSVTGTTTLPNVGQASVLTYDARNWTETVYLSARGDTVEFLPETGFMGNPARYLVPLEVGRKWRGPNPTFSDDSCWVSGIEPVTVPLGFFPESFYVQETWARSWVASSWAATWVVPEIGIVREHRQTRSGWTMYERELIAFDPGTD